ncbi:MAG: DinB family protein [Ignavibacteriaceae bacterium]|nr:DinB family protein [Ignavibacteriaceae bacterium]
MNEELKDVVNRLKNNIKTVPGKFLNFPEEKLNKKAAPTKWSKKELLGHLVDSAANNHHRFVKAQFQEEPFYMDDYAQNEWVDVQKYNDKETRSLVELWKVYNQHILFIMENIPKKNLKIKCIAEDAFENAETIFLLMKDYVDHMDHHLNKIFN